LLLGVYLGELFSHFNIPFDQVFVVKRLNPELQLKAQATAVVQKPRTLREQRQECTVIYFHLIYNFQEYSLLQPSQVSILKNIYWKEVGVLVVVWVIILAFQIGKV
jgi:hypothetical protein